MVSCRFIYTHYLIFLVLRICRYEIYASETVCVLDDGHTGECLKDLSNNMDDAITQFDDNDNENRKEDGGNPIQAFFASLQAKKDRRENSESEEDFLQRMLRFLTEGQENEEGEDYLLEAAIASVTGRAELLHEIANVFVNTSSTVLDHLNGTFHDCDLHRFSLVQAYYFMQYESSQKDAVWKRRQHRFKPELSTEKAVQLGDDLYLSQLSYADSCEDIRQSIRTFQNGTWSVQNCTVLGEPARPAHFLLTREAATAVKKNPWWNLLGRATGQKRNEDYSHTLQSLLVVRGTKELADMLSDGMLAATDYREGQAHHGIRESALWLHQTYKRRLLDLLEESKRSTTLELTLVGHSLGGGTAAVAAMEFLLDEDNRDETINVTAIGFGSPAVLSKELSQQLQGRVTTIIHDADAVPRMSGASLVNAWLRIAAHDFSSPAEADLQELFQMFKQNLPFSEWTIINDSLEKLLETLKNGLHEDMEKIRREPIKKALMDVELMPPGDCIHIFRDGLGWKGTHTPCESFEEMEVVEHFVDDHLVPPGYYAGLLGYIRRQKSDLNWQFTHDLMTLPFSR